MAFLCADSFSKSTRHYLQTHLNNRNHSQATICCTERPQPPISSHLLFTQWSSEWENTAGVAGSCLRQPQGGLIVIATALGEKG